MVLPYLLLYPVLLLSPGYSGKPGRQSRSSETAECPGKSIRSGNNLAIDKETGYNQPEQMF
jgi:hypothetical protein